MTSDGPAPAHSIAICVPSADATVEMDVCGWPAAAVVPMHTNTAIARIGTLSSIERLRDSLTHVAEASSCGPERFDPLQPACDPVPTGDTVAPVRCHRPDTRGHKAPASPCQRPRAPPSDLLELEAHDCQVVFAPDREYMRRAKVDEHEIPRKNRNDDVYGSRLWHPARLTVAYIGTMAIGLTIIELSEEAEVRT